MAPQGNVHPNSNILAITHPGTTSAPLLHSDPACTFPNTHECNSIQSTSRNANSHRIVPPGIRYMVILISRLGAACSPRGCRRIRAFQRSGFARFGARIESGCRSVAGRRGVFGRSDRDSAPPIDASPHVRDRRPAGTNAHRACADRAHRHGVRYSRNELALERRNPRRTSPDMPTNNSRDEGSVNPNHLRPLRPNAVPRRAGSR